MAALFHRSGCRVVQTLHRAPRQHRALRPVLRRCSASIVQQHDHWQKHRIQYLEVETSYAVIASRITFFMIMCKKNTFSKFMKLEVLSFNRLLDVCFHLLKTTLPTWLKRHFVDRKERNASRSPATKSTKSHKLGSGCKWRARPLLEQCRGIRSEQHIENL